MKDVTKNRLKRIEEIIKSESKYSMIAVQDETGLHWNGGNYASQGALAAAVQLVAGDHWNTPLLILSKGGTLC